MIICPKCQQENLDTARRCINCTAELAQAVPKPPPAPIATPPTDTEKIIKSLARIEQTLTRLDSHLVFYIILMVMCGAGGAVLMIF